MEERSYPPSDSEEAPSRKTGTWLICIIILATGTLFPILLMTSSFEFMFLTIIIFFPMVCLLMIVVVGCARGRSIAPTDRAEDDKILESMRLHAAPADHVADLDRYRCPECEMSFELHYAETVDEKIVLCPICGTRLFLG